MWFFSHFITFRTRCSKNSNVQSVEAQTVIDYCSLFKVLLKELQTDVIRTAAGASWECWREAADGRRCRGQKHLPVFSNQPHVWSDGLRLAAAVNTRATRALLWSQFQEPGVVRLLWWERRRRSRWPVFTSPGPSDRGRRRRRRRMWRRLEPSLLGGGLSGLSGAAAVQGSPGQTCTCSHASKTAEEREPKLQALEGACSPWSSPTGSSVTGRFPTLKQLNRYWVRTKQSWSSEAQISL